MRDFCVHLSPSAVISRRPSCHWRRRCFDRLEFAFCWPSTSKQQPSLGRSCSDCRRDWTGRRPCGSPRPGQRPGAGGCCKHRVGPTGQPFFPANDWPVGPIVAYAYDRQPGQRPRCCTQVKEWSPQGRLRPFPPKAVQARRLRRVVWSVEHTNVSPVHGAPSRAEEARKRA
jgi:hypothetical protein